VKGIGGQSISALPRSRADREKTEPPRCGGPTRH
jgi:hypothetical protein